MPKETPEPVEFSALAARFASSLAGASESVRELKSKRTILDRHLTPAFAHVRVTELEPNAVEHYKAMKLAEGLSAKTINNHLSVLRSLLRFAKGAGLLAHAPVVRNLDLAPTVPDFLEPAEAIRLLAAAEGEHHAMILLALRAGLRLGELRALRWTDLDLPGLRLRVRAESGEPSAPGTAARDIPLSAKTASTLEALPRRSAFVFPDSRGSMLSHGACKWPLYRAARRAGLEPIGWQVLRNTFTRELVTRNVSVRAVQALLGCRSTGPVLRYVPAAEDSERAAILLLDVQDGIKKGAVRWHTPRPPARKDLVPRPTGAFRVGSAPDGARALPILSKHQSGLGTLLFLTHNNPERSSGPLY